MTKPRANPYVVGQWVRGERFYGRSALIDEILAMHRSAPAPDPRSVEPGVPGELAVLIGRCLAKDPRDRIADARQVERGLRRIAEYL